MFIYPLVNSASLFIDFLLLGAGSRECIGRKLALYEAKVVICMLLQRFRAQMIPGSTMKPILRVTLRPDNLRMRIQKRDVSFL